MIDYTKFKLTIFNLIFIIIKIFIAGQGGSMLSIQMIVICYQDGLRINLLKSGI